MDAILRAIRQEDGASLRRLLAHGHLNAAVAAGSFGGGQQGIQGIQGTAQAASRGLGNLPAARDWVEFVSNYLLGFGVGAGHGGQRQPYEALLAALTPFLKLFREDEGDWLVDPMHSVVHALYHVAEREDGEELRRGKKGTRLVDCGDQLRKFFSVSLQAPNNPGKKLAALDIVNVSFKLYFRLNTLRLCKNLIRTVESRQFQHFESVRPTLLDCPQPRIPTRSPTCLSSHRMQFPIAQKVTYKFYEGRLAVFDEHYEEAQEALTYALTHCHAGSKKNISLILKYLVPVGLLLGRLPSPNLAKEYSAVLSPYLPIAGAVRTGNVGAFYQAMQAQRNRLVKDGTLLLLEKLQASVYRRLLRRVYVVHAQMEPTKAAQIPLAMYKQALQVAGITLDMSEIECTLQAVRFLLSFFLSFFAGLTSPVASPCRHRRKPDRAKVRQGVHQPQTQGARGSQNAAVSIARFRRPGGRVAWWRRQ